LSLILKEEHILRVFENRVLTRTFGPKDEVVGGWRRLHNEELHNLYASPNIIQVTKSWRMRWSGHVACMGEINADIVFAGKPEGGDHLEDLGIVGRIIGWEIVDWIHVAQDRDQWQAHVHSNEPLSSIKCGEFLC
jgi:hypothetical protein